MTSSRTSTTSAADERSSEGEAGTGLLGSIVGVTVFLVLVLFAVQLVLNLYATSAVTAVAFDAARVVAGEDGGEAAIDEAEARARAVLGRFEADGGQLAFAWDLSSPDVVRLTVRASRPSLLPAVPFPFDHVERTVTVRRERLQEVAP
jgi:hypothetical protein